ncbi:uncharacterized protein K02A2.6-like [Anneissia japonica]|uniref:uncharacterized protein K02A2.6-like n=1 Tax=Anneissia japonica TaxID=1529436 RepID=UPI001425AF76|nr:uncharacterized protein K02A2.6-like [Anneissia japonica]
MRLQGMLLRLQPYDLKVTYKPGKEVVIGDTLSRANLPDTVPDMKPIAVNMTDYIAVTLDRYAEFQRCTAAELNELHTIILKGWPDTREETPHAIRQYWNTRNELSVVDGIVYKGMRIVVPPTMCKQRARESLYWPGMREQVESLVKDCQLCNDFQNRQHTEPLKFYQLPELPWNEVACDLFEFEQQDYMITIDYYSKFIEVDHLPMTDSSTVVDKLKAQFSRHGIP